MLKNTSVREQASPTVVVSSALLSAVWRRGPGEGRRRGRAADPPPLTGSVTRPPANAHVVNGLAALLLAAALLDFGCARTQAPRATEPEVLTAPVVQKDVPVVSEWIGTLDGSVNAIIRPKVEGYLLRQIYKEGQFVNAKDPLFEIDPRQFKAAVDQANGVLGQAEAELAKATQDVDRFTPLVAERAVSQQELDNAFAAQRNAKAAVASAKASVEQALLNLAWTKITSPIDGIVGIAKAQVGDLVNNQTVMTTVSTVDPIRVTYGISEREYLRFAARINRPNYATTRQGSLLDLVLDDGSVFPHKGQAVLVDREVDVKTGTMTIKGFFPNPGHILRPGQYAKVRAALEVKTGALLVPQKAVTELQGGFRVAVVGPDSKVEIRNVEPGERVGSLWIIDKGLKPGESVIVAGIQFVRPGMGVKAKPAPSEDDGASRAQGR
ncbi:MAG TPA: efflux RND transporter periplasmic adaptor subunit [Vicinamibacteria bacterium]|nr:efflux RND transporter periplasmic adaptor subunit [Vicinamibacteria bacterium]